MVSLWAQTAQPQQQYKKLTGHIKTEALIIGGGLAGVLCAHRLRESGISCVLLEATRLGMGVTQNTTAKITAQHGLIYSQLLQKLGMEKAKQYYNINERAVSEFRELSLRIPCDFEEKDSFVYSMHKPRKLEKEAEAYRKLHIPMHFQENPPLPFRTDGALCMKGQAQFHPLKLLYGLAAGMDIYENTFVRELDGNRAITKKGSVQAEHVILATHFPMVSVRGLYFLKMYQHRSYVIALEGGPDLGGMYVDERQEGHSFRNYGNMLLLGGGDHRTGKQGGGHAELRRLATAAYPGSTERYAWATQDCMTLDGIPYIGVHRKSTSRLYVATGFNKWGMTGAMAASILLNEMICNNGSEYMDLFSPQRSMLHPQVLLNTAQAAAGLLQPGKRCPHMGCSLKWNPAERTWDCPCHGSRFEENGAILDNPAIKKAKV